MGMLESLVKGISQAEHNRFTVIMGYPGSGKTTDLGTFPKPLLLVVIGNDGGAEVLKNYSDTDIKTILLESDKPGTPGAKHIGVKFLELLNELSSKPCGFKTIAFDAYSSVEEGVLKYNELIKGKALSLPEKGDVGRLMLSIRDKIVTLSTGDTEIVAVSHVKTTQTTDPISGEVATRLVPKMSINNGNILLERASNVMYCCRKTVLGNDNKPAVRFLTYIGAHPNMDTKLRVAGKVIDVGFYVEDFSYDSLQKIINGKQNIQELKKLNVVETAKNPFTDETDNTGE